MTLLFVVIISLCIVLCRYWISGKLEKQIRFSLAVFLVINELSWHVWNASSDQWIIQTMLPLHLCGIMVWSSAYLLFTKNYRAYEFVYFLGLGGAVQALLTPNIGDYGFPHFRFFQSMIAHGLIVIAALYATVIWKYRPTFESCRRVFLWGNGFLMVVMIINYAIGSNYMFLLHKPQDPSLLDYFGPWPFYLVGIEISGLITMALLYLPFYRVERKNEVINGVGPQ